MRLPAVVTGMLVGALLGLAPGVAAASETSDPALRTLAQRHHLGIGTAVNMDALAADSTYRERIAREFSTVTAENVMKWEVIEPRRGEYDWSQADRLVDFARQNNQRVRGHTLVWHSQLPGWLTATEFTPEQLRDILRTHIRTTVAHFRGKIWQWDVVNEAFNEDGTLRDSLWLRKLGPGYIADAFRWAHEADPRASLYYNDYDVEDVNAKSTAAYLLIARLRAQGVPIHGMGLQSHYTSTYAPASMHRNLARFSALGMQTAVTEADVRMVMPPSPAKLADQAKVYRTMMKACLATPRCVSFTFWGFTDKYSWVPGYFPGQGAANILDENFRAKPAYTVLVDDLTRTRPRY